MRETTVEKRLVRRCREAGGDCIKILPVVGGYPDRLAMLPWGRLYFVETKAPDGVLRPLQKVFKARAEAIGIPVAVLYTPEQVDAWAEEHLVDPLTADLERLQDGLELLGSPMAAELARIIEKHKENP